MEAVVLKSPSVFLQTIIGQSVQVKLTSGVEYHGKMTCLDGYMNIALEETSEYFNGALTNTYGDLFIRGNNGFFWADFSFVCQCCVRIEM